MNTKMLTHVRRLFCVEGVERHIVRHNCRAWIRSVRLLGDRWVYAKTFATHELKVGGVRR